MAPRTYSLLQSARFVLEIGSIGATLFAALLAPASPALGREYLLEAPLWLGLPLVVLFGVVEAIARTTRGGGYLPAAIAWITSLAVVGTAVLVTTHLWLGWSTPVDERDYNYWHLWPLFIWVNLLPIAGLPLLAAATLKAVHWFHQRRAI